MSIKAPFSWSWSRHGTYTRCQRQYWYEYYGSKNGWSTRASPETRQLYILKRALSRPQWVGILVHEAAERLLNAAKQGTSLPLDQLTLAMVDKATRQLADARAQKHRDAPKAYQGFIELEYQNDPGEDTWSATMADLQQQIEAVHDHRLMQRLLSVPSQIVEVEALERLNVDGLQVWLSIDVLVRNRDGGLIIIDWKTGQHHKPETIAGQLALYGLYVQHRYRAPSDAIQGAMAFTRTGDFELVPFSEEVASETQAHAHASATKMLEHLPDPRRDAAPIESFRQLEEGSEPCRTCAYRGPCRGQEDRFRPLVLF